MCRMGAAWHLVPLLMDLLSEMTVSLEFVVSEQCDNWSLERIDPIASSSVADHVCRHQWHRAVHGDSQRAEHGGRLLPRGT